MVLEALTIDSIAKNLVAGVGDKFVDLLGSAIFKGSHAQQTRVLVVNEKVSVACSRPRYDVSLWEDGGFARQSHWEKNAMAPGAPYHL
ncbi:hypothetical protein E2562_000931 [Oryza meyeriana var. granulata]|uniref:Uncharacterized protein n=1 Tax=Oryza meyeriana var. granulata TaxID=110450 RepID=A0A6G1CYZ6_9ORYZ|nr:hypothetical protein E2562_000931 [Oryza meyeriana var. granulata]